MVGWKKMWFGSKLEIWKRYKGGGGGDDRNVGWSTISRRGTDYLEAIELSRFTRPKAVA